MLVEELYSRSTMSKVYTVDVSMSSTLNRRQDLPGVAKLFSQKFSGNSVKETVSVFLDPVRPVTS